MIFSGKSETSASVKKRSWPIKLVCGIVAAIALLAIFVRGDWFIPIVEKQASAALHRRVTLEHLHLHPSRVTSLQIEGLRVAQPEGFQDRKEAFASVKNILVSIDVWKLLTGGGILLPRILVDTPRADIVTRADGTSNFQFGDRSSKPSKSSKTDFSSLPRIGDLEVRDGVIDVDLAKPKTAMKVNVSTADAVGDRGRAIMVKASGRYDDAPITAYIKAGSLNNLTEEKYPYPIEARIENGPTKMDLKGIVKDPLHFKGTDLLLHFSGPDMAQLYGLTGVPIPHTPAFDIRGKLEYAARKIRFRDFTGKMGTSDIGGTISVAADQKPPYVDAKLHSKNVDLRDLGGFIGAKPGKEKDASQIQRGKLLPSEPINIPKLNAVNAHLVYHGDHIQNKETPFDDINADVIIDHGAIDIKRLSYAIGSGELTLKGTLKPAGAKEFNANLAVDAQKIPIGNLLKNLGGRESQGRMGGRAKLTSRGNSIATLLGNGNGGVSIAIDHGGEITALLPNLLGLKLGSALLSALGIPNKTDLKCFVADLPLENGVLNTRAFLLQTDGTRTLGGGTINLRTEALDYHVTTRSTNFSILSLPGEVNIGGSLRSPTILPGAEMLGRAAATAALAVTFPPALVIPTIQFGVGQGSACETALSDMTSHPASGTSPTDGKPAETGNKNTGSQRKKLSPKQIHNVWKKRLSQTPRTQN